MGDTVEITVFKGGRKAVVRFGTNVRECEGDVTEVRKFVRMARSVAVSNGYAVTRKTGKAK